MRIIRSLYPIADEIFRVNFANVNIFRSKDRSIDPLYGSMKNISHHPTKKKK